MTDEEFDILKTDIENAMKYLESLQKLYFQQTGRRYVPDVKAYREAKE